MHTEPQPSILDDKNRKWFQRFCQEKGRAPRVLHIGNIANNAYLNAKILNQVGISSDVLSCDFYHIMGCPEWEDAEFDEPISDHFMPDWNSVNLRHFRRPCWFAQGPMYYAMAYLLAYRQGRLQDADLIWNYLVSPIVRNRRSLVGIGYEVLRCILPSFCKEAYQESKAILRGLGRIWKKWTQNKHDDPNRLFPSLTNDPCSSGFAKRVGHLKEAYCAFFPERDHKTIAKDLIDHGPWYNLYQGLLKEYDFVIGYGTDGIIPAVAGNVPYYAFEHGTIRNIPFQNSTQGRLCALTYRLADGTFISNCDNQRAAQDLGLRNFRFLPHPINENLPDPSQGACLHERIRKLLKSRFVVFHPSRQHWEERRHPDWEKGNDIFIRGFAKFVKEVCPTANAIFVNWGQTVNATRRLLSDLQIAHRVTWIAPQPNQKMVSYIQGCDVLADQFYLGAFGSTMPKALMLGVPAMLYLNERMHRWCLDEMPPVLNTRTSEEVFLELTNLYQRPDYGQELRQRGRIWYQKYHSNRVIANALANAVLERFFDRACNIGSIRQSAG